MPWIICYKDNKGNIRPCKDFHEEYMTNIDPYLLDLELWSNWDYLTNKYHTTEIKIKEYKEEKTCQKELK